MTRRSKSTPTPDPPTVTMHTLSRRVAQLGPDRLPVAISGGVEAGDVVAGEVVVRLGPGPDGGQARAEEIGDESSGAPMKIALSRIRG